MLTRREMLIVAGGVAVAARRASAAPPIEIVDQRGARIAWRRPHVFSIDNDNESFLLYVEVDKLAQGEWPTLRWEQAAVRAHSTGGDATRWTATFALGRDPAVRLARALGVTLQERRRLDDGLVGVFRAASQPFQAGQPMIIILRVENRGTGTVQFVLGGRQRGPRDNRFEFTLRAVGGLPLPAIVAHDFGGLSTTKKLGPGESVDVSADLQSWAAIDSAGDYEVKCAYEAELHASDGRAEWPERAADMWTWRPTGKIKIVVR